jgi:hypothetical protein
MPNVRETGNRAVAIEDERGQPRRALDDALGAEHDGNARLRGRLCDGGPRVREERRVRRRYALAGRTVAGHVGLREADDAGAAGAGLGDRLDGPRDGVLGVAGKGRFASATRRVLIGGGTW